MDKLLVIFIAATLGMGIGALWYGPLFGKQWLRFMGMTKEDMVGAKKSGMVKNYILAFAGEFLTAYVLWYIINLTGSYALSIMTGLIFWLWLGFSAPTALDKVLWERKPWAIFLLNISHGLVKLLAMGFAIIYLI